MWQFFRLPGKTGAATLICLGAGRVGAGLVTLLVPASLNPILEVKLTETMTLPIAQTDEQTAALAALPELLKFVKGKQVPGHGAGLSLHPETGNLVRTCCFRLPARWCWMPTRLRR